MFLNEARRIRAMIEASADNYSDNEAARSSNRKLHSKWKPHADYTVGKRVQYDDRLYRCRQRHTSQEGWEPNNVPSLWEVINEVYDGTKEDPIPYDGNMSLEKGKYYAQSGKTYLCIRSTGIPVYHSLVELEKLSYVEELIVVSTQVP